MDSADINEAVKHCKDQLKLGKGDRSFPKTQSIVGLLSKARNKELPLDEVLRREAFHLLPHADGLARLGDAYNAYRRDKGLLDYDDLLFELEALLRENPLAAASLRQRFSHILVDEYQDTNLVQARIVRLLAGPLDGPPGNVMAVGDEAQSIYAFRGANVRNILDFPTLFPGARVVRLEENYRSTKPVLDVANNLLSHAAESFRKNLFTRKEGGDPVRLVTPLSDMPQRSIASCTAALELAPDLGRARYIRALAHWRLQQLALAEDDLSAALEATTNAFPHTSDKVRLLRARGALRMLRSNEPGMCDDLAAACALGDCDGLAAARGQQMCLTSPRQEGGQPEADAVTPQVPAKAGDTAAKP